MNRFVWPMLLLSGWALATQAVAQGQPVFTAPLVHPISSPPEDLDPQPRRSGNVLKLRDRKPAPKYSNKPTAQQTQEVSESFRQACIQGLGQADAAADWALSRGFVPAPKLSQELAVKLAAPGEAARIDPSASVFIPAADDDTLMLVVSGQPATCAVISRGSVDGNQLRSRMEGFVAGWTGQQAAPTPVTSLELNPKTPEAARMVGYKFVTGAQTLTMNVLAPTRVGKSIAFMTLGVDGGAPAAPAEAATTPAEAPAAEAAPASQAGAN